ncbi:MAG TPA: hypothetical protein VMF88_10595 [Bacteroidota bacterium]|nr:hypothetical protein [Bacteroidota bacterium]
MLEIPRRFIYLDEEGIRSLYAQIEQGVPVEITKGEGKQSAGKLGAKIGLAKALGTLFRLLELDGTGEFTKSKSINESVRIEIKAENLLGGLVNKLSSISPPSLFDNLGEASKATKLSDGPVYILVKSTFDAPQFYGDRRRAIENINSVGYVYFEKDKKLDNYKYSDNYFKEIKVPLAMAASISKFPSSEGSLHSFSRHEAFFFSGYSGENIPLNVFGILFPIPKIESFQIKPYAIWI